MKFSFTFPYFDIVRRGVIQLYIQSFLLVENLGE